MNNFQITVKPTDWGWRWEMTWYDPERPLATAYQQSTEPYPDRDSAKAAAEKVARRMVENESETYVYQPQYGRH